MKQRLILDILEILLILILILPIRLFFFEPFFVKGSSMEPNYYSFDYLIIDKITYRFSDPQRGDVIVFHPPFDNKIYYIKRIIGLPGEKIVIINSRIFIYNDEKPEGFELREDYLKDNVTIGDQEIVLKDGEYFVLGDNREVSSDSRLWGPVRRERIIGRAIFHLSPHKIFNKLAEIF